MILILIWNHLKYDFTQHCMKHTQHETKDASIHGQEAHGKLRSSMSQNTTEEWQISHKISIVVQDGTANMKHTGGLNSWTDINCSSPIEQIHHSCQSSCITIQLQYNWDKLR